MIRSRLAKIGAAVALAVVVSALVANLAEAQAVAKTVLRLVRIYALDPPLDIVGGVETEPVRTGIITSIDGGYVLVNHGVRTSSVTAPDAGYLAIGGLGVDLVTGGIPPCDTSGAVIHIAPGFLASCDGSKWRFGATQLVTGYSLPPGLGNQGPANNVVFTFFPPLTAPACVDAVRLDAVPLVAGTCGGACAALPSEDQVTHLLIKQGATTFCDVSIPCTAGTPTDGGTYFAACTGTATAGARTDVLYNGNCTANPFSIFTSTSRAGLCL